MLVYRKCVRNIMNSMVNNEKLKGKYKIHVVDSDNIDNSDLSPEDQDMDTRVNAAVKSAIQKAKICNKPIAKYDLKRKKAYIQTADGVKTYID